MVWPLSSEPRKIIFPAHWTSASQSPSLNPYHDRPRPSLHLALLDVAAPPPLYCDGGRDSVGASPERTTGEFEFLDEVEHLCLRILDVTRYLRGSPVLRYDQRPYPVRQVRASAPIEGRLPHLPLWLRQPPREWPPCSKDCGPGREPQSLVEVFPGHRPDVGVERLPRPSDDPE